GRLRAGGDLAFLGGRRHGGAARFITGGPRRAGAVQLAAMSRSVFRCIAGCDGAYALDEVIYKCPKCGDLLEVVHDLETLKKRSAAAWITLFDDRYLRTHWHYGSGVWC